MYLFINNLGQNKIVLGLFQSRQKVFWLKLKTQQNKSENLLSGIDRLLNQNKKTLKALNGIIVVNGPGSFTGIRVGLSVANTLVCVLRIPVIGINLNQGKDNQELLEQGIKRLLKTKTSKPVMPFYGKEPNITQAKSSY